MKLAVIAKLKTEVKNPDFLFAFKINLKWHLNGILEIFNFLF